MSGAADRMPGQAMNRNSCLARWVDAPVHTLPMGACTGAQLDKGALLCRSVRLALPIGVPVQHVQVLCSAATPHGDWRCVLPRKSK